MVLSCEGHDEGVWRQVSRAQNWNKLLSPAQDLLSVTFSPGLLLPAAGTCLLLPSVPVTAGNNSCLPVTVFPIKTPWGITGALCHHFSRNCLIFPTKARTAFPSPPALLDSHLQTLSAGPWKKWIPLMGWTPLRTAAGKGGELPHNGQGFGKPRGCSLWRPSGLALPSHGWSPCTSAAGGEKGITQKIWGNPSSSHTRGWQESDSASDSHPLTQRKALHARNSRTLTLVYWNS